MPVQGLTTAGDGQQDANRQRVMFPRYTSSFVGRAAQVAELVELLTSRRLVTIVGMGGAGKTRIAVEAGRVAAPRYADGAAFVDLSAVTHADLVAPAVAAALTPDGEAWASIDRAGAEEWIAAFLQSRHALVVLDNCEHLLGPCRELVRRVIEACPSVVVCATTREALGVTGEVVWAIPPLPAADAGSRLFVDRARSAGAVITPAELATVTQICEHLDGLPLAIELAAAQTPFLTPPQLFERLDDRLQLLGRAGGGPTPRQQTLRAAIDWSYQLLEPDEQMMLQRLSVFPGPFSLEAAESVAELGAAPLVGLAAKSLVAVRHGEGTRRYDLPESVRAFARAAVPAAVASQLSDRHRDRFLAWLGEMPLDRLIFGFEETAVVRDEADNLRAAIGWSIETRRVDLAADLAVRMVGMFWLQGRETEGFATLAGLAERAGLDDRRRAECLAAASTLDLVGGPAQWERAIGLARRSLTLDPGGAFAPLAWSVLGQMQANDSIDEAHRNAAPIELAGGLAALDTAENHPRATPAMKRLAVGYRLCLHLYPWTPPGKAAVAAAARSIVQDAEDGFDVMHVNLTGGVASLIAGAPSEALEFARRMRTGLWNQHYGGIIGGVALARMGESEAAHRRLAEVANTALGSAGFHLTTDCLVSFAALRIARGDVARGAGLLESAVVRLGPIHSQRSPQGGALYAHCVDLVRARLDRATRHSAREAARSHDPVEVLREEISAL